MKMKNFKKNNFNWIFEMFAGDNQKDNALPTKQIPKPKK